MKKHPYYDSERKQRTETIALQSLAWCIAIGTIMTLILLIIK